MTTYRISQVSRDSTKSRRIERRSHRRFELELELRCKLMDSREVFPGKTCDLCSGGVRFQVDCHIPVGTNVELSILWPVLLGNVCVLKLVMRGPVVRSGADGIAIQRVSYEFRTAGTVADKTGPTRLQEAPRDIKPADCAAGKKNVA
jgi:hypothetical protein